MGVHALAYIRKALSVISSKRNAYTKRPTKRGNVSLGLNVAGLVIGVMAAIALLPKYGRGWGHFVFHVPSPLSLGIVLALVAVAVAMPLIRLTRQRAKRHTNS